jgi:hypothetical protein
MGALDFRKEAFVGARQVPRGAVEHFDGDIEDDEIPAQNEDHGWSFPRLLCEGKISRWEFPEEDITRNLKRVAGRQINCRFGLEMKEEACLYISKAYGTSVVECNSGLFMFAVGFEHARLISTDLCRGLPLLAEENEKEFEGQWREVGEAYDASGEDELL